MRELPEGIAEKNCTERQFCNYVVQTDKKSASKLTASSFAKTNQKKKFKQRVARRLLGVVGGRESWKGSHLLLFPTPNYLGSSEGKERAPYPERRRR